MFQVEVELWGGPMDGHKRMEPTELRRYGPEWVEAVLGPRQKIEVLWRDSTEPLEFGDRIEAWTGTYECEVISRESGPPWIYRWKGWDR